MPNNAKFEQQLLDPGQLELARLSRQPALRGLEDAAVTDLVVGLRQAAATARDTPPTAQGPGPSVADLLAAALRRALAERRRRGLTGSAQPSAPSGRAITAKPAKNPAKRRKPAGPRADLPRKPAARKPADSRKTDLRTEPHRIVKPARGTVAADVPPLEARPGTETAAEISAETRAEAPQTMPNPKSEKQAKKQAARAAAKEARKAAEKAARKAAKKTAGMAAENAAAKIARKQARQAERDARKAERQAERKAAKDAAKAERKAARASLKAAAKDASKDKTTPKPEKEKKPAKGKDKNKDAKRSPSGKVRQDRKPSDRKTRKD